MFIVGIKTLLTQDISVEKPTMSVRYYPVYTNEKWGVINSKGEIVIEPHYEEMITIPDSKIDLFICIYDVNYSDGTYKTRVINSKNETILTEYDLVEAVENIDENGILSFEKEVLKVKKGDFYGLIDYSGKEVLKVEYENIEALEEAKKSLKKDENSSANDTQLSFIEVNSEDSINTKIYNKDMELKLEGIIVEKNTEKGYIRLRQNDEYKYYNFNLEEIEPSSVLNATMYVDKKEGKYGYVDKDGNVVVDYIYDDATEQNTYGYSAVKKNGYWYSLNSEGTVSSAPYELKNNLVIDFIGKWHLAEDLNSYYYTDI